MTSAARLDVLGVVTTLGAALGARTRAGARARRPAKRVEEMMGGRPAVDYHLAVTCHVLARKVGAAGWALARDVAR